MSLEPVVVTIEVMRPIERVFAYYTQRIADWWPLTSHSVSREEAVSCAIEGRAGGRIFETNRAGETHIWGTILVWEPPHRLVHSWHPSHPGKRETEVSVTFTALGGNETRVRLEHSGFEVHGDRAADVRANYVQGWGTIIGTDFRGGLAGS